MRFSLKRFIIRTGIHTIGLLPSDTEIYISRNGSRLIGDDEYDDYDFDFDEDEDASDEYCGECAIDDDAQKSVVIEDNASEEK